MSCKRFCLVFCVATLLHLRPAWGEDVAVNCSDRPDEELPSPVVASPRAAIELLKEKGRNLNHSIDVYGSCLEDEILWIQGFEGLSIRGRTAGASIEVGAEAEGIFYFWDSRVEVEDVTLAGGGVQTGGERGNVEFRRCLIRDGGSGVTAYGGFVGLSGTRIQDVRVAALRVDAGASATLYPSSGGGETQVTSLVNQTKRGFGIILGGLARITRGTVIQGFGHGVFCHGGRLDFYAETPSNEISGNRYGITGESCFVSMNGPLQVSDNSIAGLWLEHSSAISQWGIGPQSFERNGTAGNASSAGIHAGFSSYVSLSEARLSDNLGPGLQLDTGSGAILWGAEILGNAGYGVHVEEFSTVDLTLGTEIRENGSADLQCGRNGTFRGDISQVEKVSCPGVGRRNLSANRDD